MTQPITNYSNTIVALRDVERSSGSFMERSIVRGLFLGPPICLVACMILGNLLVLAGPHKANFLFGLIRIACKVRLYGALRLLLVVVQLLDCHERIRHLTSDIAL